MYTAHIIYLGTNLLKEKRNICRLCSSVSAFANDNENRGRDREHGKRINFCTCALYCVRCWHLNEKWHVLRLKYCRFYLKGVTVSVCVCVFS